MRVFHLTPWKLKLLFGELDGISLVMLVFGDWSHVEDIVDGYILLVEGGRFGDVYVQGSMV
jgi:GDPmannose 4,6-dehydratase